MVETLLWDASALLINWGIKETQEMLDFCGEHNITSDIELIDMQDINKAYDRIKVTM
jgi:D-arabinose 1-dehydrogenase-like Zn-dependent alcohol dehydrogenase